MERKSLQRGRQSVALAAAVIGLAACAEPAMQVNEVRPGVEVLLADSLTLVQGRPAGLITNHTAIGRDRTHAIDLLLDGGVELVALFGPEHGIRGDVEEGQLVESGVDAKTGLPVHSLYSDTRKPTPEMLDGVAVLLFDIQDIGARYYTYVSTMALAMQAAAEHGIPFIVLDRPNPIGGELMQGNVLEPEHSSFVGLYPIPMRHGMTAGELARLFNARFDIGADLHVIPATGWTRDQWLDQTGLPWLPTSPNMPSLESATHYPGTCLFEGTNLSVGRGTERAFQHVGAPWLDGEALAERLNDYGLAGVRFEATTFTPVSPSDEKFGGEAVSGVRFVATDRRIYDPTVAAVATLIEARRLAGDRWQWYPRHFDRLAGTGRLREQIESGEALERIIAEWPAELEAFEALRAPYLLYR